MTVRMSQLSKNVKTKYGSTAPQEEVVKARQNARRQFDGSLQHKIGMNQTKQSVTILVNISPSLKTNISCSVATVVADSEQNKPFLCVVATFSKQKTYLMHVKVVKSASTHRNNL